MKTIFFVTGFPRSRTAWLATLLTWGDCFCFHDGFEGVANLKEFHDKMHSSPGFIVGNSDPANLLFHKELIGKYPCADWIIVERPIQECWESLRKVSGLEFDMVEAAKTLALLKSRSSSVRSLITVPFERLNDLSTLLRLVAHIGINMPEDRIRQLMRLNIQVNPNLFESISFESVEKMNRLRSSFNECVLA